VHEQFGLKCNPFPAIPKAEFSTANRMLRELDSDPLKSSAEVARILHGCDEEFIKLCCQKFEVGKRVSFVVSWPE
jgi:hypothetical protein